MNSEPRNPARHLRLERVIPLAEQTGEEAAAAVPRILAELVSATPGGEVTLRLTGSEHQTVLVDWLVNADTEDAADELAVAVSASLRGIGTVAEVEVGSATGAATSPKGTAWTLGPRARMRPVGFSNASARARWQPGPGGPPDAARLLEGLLHNPGSSLTVALRDGHSSDGQPWCQTRIVVTSVTNSVPVVLRAALSAWAPDLQLHPFIGITEAEFLVPHDAVARLVPIPVSKGLALPGLETGGSAPLPAPAEVPGLRLGMGSSPAGLPRVVALSSEERVRHVHVLGRTGTGKSSLLAAVVHGVAQRGEGAMVLDPHGHLVDRIVAELPADALPRTCLVRTGELAHPVRVNPLATSDPVRRELVIRDLCDMFSAVFDPHAQGIVGPRFEERLAVLLRSLAAVRGARTSLLDAARLSNDDELQAAVRARLEDPALLRWWSADDLGRRSSERGDLLSWFGSKFERFMGSHALRAVLGTGVQALDLTHALDTAQIILIDLSKAEIGEPAARVLGMMHLTSLWTAALQRRQSDPFTVVVDEAHVFNHSALPAILTEGRKFGMSVVLAHQFLSQLPADLSAALTGNVATTVAFRCGNEDAVSIARTMGDPVRAAALTSLPDLTGIVHRTSFPAAPHTVSIDHANRISPGDCFAVAARVRQLQERTWRELCAPHASAQPLQLEDIAGPVSQRMRTPDENVRRLAVRLAAQRTIGKS